MYISKGFQPEYFVHQYPMCDLSDLSVILCNTAFIQLYFVAHSTHTLRHFGSRSPMCLGFALLQNIYCIGTLFTHPVPEGINIIKKILPLVSQCCRVPFISLLIIIQSST